MTDIYRPHVYEGDEPIDPTPRLRVNGPYFFTDDGSLFIRRSCTAFTAAKRITEDRAEELFDFLEWVEESGFTEIRVFTRTAWTGPPHSGVETGWAYDSYACETLLIEAAARGLYVELVAHTYDSANLDEMARHLQAVDELCLRYPNALLEVFNEPQGNTTHERLAALLLRYTPKTPGWSSGAYDPNPNPSGQSISHHTDRKEEWCRCFKDAWEIHEGYGPYENFSPPFKGPVMLDEPPQVEQTIRDYPQHNAEDDWRAYGAGAAFFAAGATMHSFPTLQQCQIPEDGRVLDCIEAFHEGFDAVPLQPYFRYDRNPPGDALRRYVRWDASGRKYELSVRPFAFRQV